MSAARESQGYLIAVIILVLLSLVLALVAFLGWSSSAEHADVRTKLEADQKFDEISLKIKDSQIETLKGMIGDLGVNSDQIKSSLDLMTSTATQGNFEPEQRNVLNESVAEFKKIHESYLADVSDNAVTIDGEVAKNATYRERIRNLTSLIAKKVTEVNIQVNQSEDAQAASRLSIEEKQKQLEVAQKEASDAAKLAEQAKDAKLQSERELTQKLNDNIEKLDDITSKFEDYQQVASETERKLSKQITDFEGQVAKLKQDLRRYTTKSFEFADGKIVNVASSYLHSVFIDLGSRDGLRVNRQFTVYDKLVTNFEAAEPKGVIEVIRVDETKAEAKIIEEDPSNPILASDHILTPTWDPGVAVRYALSGSFDLDGDKLDDTDKLIRIIERNGGEVVVRHDEEGNMIGKLDSSIDFLVEGNAELIDRGGVIRTMEQMSADADKYTVSKLELDKLKKQLGIKSRAKTIKWDPPAKEGGFSRSLKSTDR